MFQILFSIYYNFLLHHDHCHHIHHYVPTYLPLPNLSISRFYRESGMGL